MNNSTTKVNNPTKVITGPNTRFYVLDNERQIGGILDEIRTA